MYQLITSLPDNLILETPFTSGLMAYRSKIICTADDCDINEIVLTSNGEDVTDMFISKIDVDTYEINISTVYDGVIFRLTGSLKTVAKPFRLLISGRGFTSSKQAGVYNSSIEFDITYITGYGKGRAYAYINSVKNNSILTETETGYHVKILESNYNKNDTIELKITTTKLKTYNVTYSPDNLEFSPPVTEVMTADYRGNILPPKDYHFITCEVTLNGSLYDGCYKVNDKSYRVEFNKGEGTETNNYAIVARLEKDITKDNEDKYPFIRIYNPTNSDLDKLSKQRYVTPEAMEIEDIADDIIELQKIYLTLPKNEPYQDMLIGKKNTNIKVNQITDTEMTLDCGSINIEEVFHNIADYKLTNIMFYIPFVGLREIDTDLVMQHEIGLKYDVSLISGDFIATLYLRDINKTIELFSGNMVYKIPYQTDYKNSVHGDLRDNDKSMIDLTPYCIIKSHAINNSPYTKKIKEYMKLEDLTGFTVIDNIELYIDENTNMLYDEETELYTLLKEGIVL